MVTLLFTDLVGSTASASSLGEQAAQQVRQRHFALVRGQLERHRGREVKTMGDGFMVAFTSTRRAVQCAVDIQRAVEKERAASPATPRVRIGLNAGEVVEAEEDLFGLMVNAAARIQALAAGGQVLVSESVKMLLGPASGIEFRDAGEHYLKGFAEKWRLYEVPYEVGGATGPQAIFVGRQEELTRFEGLWNAALDGRGSVIAVVGEPGIGKTRLVREFGEYASRQGAQVHWGATHESAGAPAFWPWVRAIRSLNAAIDLEPLRPYIEERAEDLVRLFPEVRTVVPDLPGPRDLPASESESAQFRLFDATAGYLKRVAEVHPLVVVLDDLHWADKPTLLLLQYLANELGDSRILIVGTYRDVEVGRQHPLESALAELLRTDRFHVVDLKGLEEGHVRDYITRASGTEPSPGLVAEILAQTEGNPFFLGEVIALMAKEGTLASGGVIAIPQSVRAVVGQRLNKLSRDCNEVLRIAAVAGRQFRLDVLGEVCGKDEDTVLDLLDEAVDARVVDESNRIGEYQFHHALMQETLLEELTTNRRVRLHARVADALERRYADRPDRAAELAFHFGEAAPLSGEYAQKALEYAQAAAAHAEQQHAWADAVRHMEAAVALADDAGADEAALLLELGRLAQLAVEWRLSWRSLLKAFDVFTTRWDAAGQAEAAILLARIATGNPRRAAAIDDALDAVGPAPSELRVRLLLAGATWVFDALRQRRLEEAEQLIDLIDPEKLLTDVRLDAAGARAVLNVMSSNDGESAMARNNELLDIRDELIRRGRSQDALRCAQLLVNGVARFGDLGRALVLADEGLTLAAQAHERQNAGFLRQWTAGVKLARCEWDAAIETASQIPRENFAGDLVRALVADLRGAPDAGVGLMPSRGWRGGRTMEMLVLSARARFETHAGLHSEAHIDFSAWLERHNAEETPMSRTTGIEHLDDVLPLLGDELFRSEIYEALCEASAARLSFHGIGYDHLRGDLALGLGRLEEARVHYRTGVDWALTQGAHMEQAQCLHGFAKLAEAGSKPAEAVAYLDQAREIFSKYGVRYFERKCLEMRQRLS